MEVMTSSSISTTQLYPAIDNTIGAFFLGVLIAMSLWGGASVQVHHYFDKYPEDTWRLKCFVLFLWILDTLHQSLITHSVYTYLVSHYGDRSYLDVVVVGHMESMLLCGFVCFLVQAFLLRRVWCLSEKNKLLSVTLLLLMTAQMVSIVVFYVKGRTLPTFTSLQSLAWLSRTINILSALSDIALALTLIVLLHRFRPHVGFKHSDSVLKKLILYTLGTGFATSVCAVMTLVLNLVFPDNLVYMVFYLCDTPLYTIALLTMLNLRKCHNERIKDLIGLHLSDIAQTSPQSTKSTPSTMDPPNHVVIKVDTERERYADRGSTVLCYPVRKLVNGLAAHEEVA